MIWGSYLAVSVRITWRERDGLGAMSRRYCSRSAVNGAPGPGWGRFFGTGIATPDGQELQRLLEPVPH